MSMERKARKAEREKAKFEAMVQEEIRMRKLFMPRPIAQQVQRIFASLRRTS